MRLGEKYNMEFLLQETEVLSQKLEEKALFVRRLNLDFVYFKEKNYRNVESHQQAAIEFIKVMNKKSLGYLCVHSTELHCFDDLPIFIKSLAYPYAVNPELMYAKSVLPPAFFSTKCENGKYESSYAYSILSQIYKPQREEIFLKANEYLFPMQENLIIYQWNNDWSNYFSIGREEYGAYLWTIYQRETEKFTVIGASMRY